MHGKTWAILVGVGMIFCTSNELTEPLTDAFGSPYYKAENFIAPGAVHQKSHQSYNDGKSLGRDGPVSIMYTKEYSASHQYWHATLNSLGVESNKAHMSGSNVEVWTNTVAVEPNTATRSYSATAYYLPNASRPNLHLLTNAAVHEILLEHDEEWAARGVRFNHNGGSFTVKVYCCATLDGYKH